MKTILNLFFWILFVMPGLQSHGQTLPQEGVTSEISADALRGLEDWLVVTKAELQRLSESVEKMDLHLQEEAYRQGLDRILSASKGEIEFLTRNVMYRAREIHDLLRSIPQEPDTEAQLRGFARRILKRSVNQAMELAPWDIQVVQAGRTLEIPKSPERVSFGLNWAEEMVKLSFSSPTNRSHFMFLRKVMGFLYNDITQDDRYNRILANVAHQFLWRHKQLEDLNPLTPIQFLEAAKSIRDFLLTEIGRAKQAVSAYSSIPLTENLRLRQEAAKKKQHEQQAVLLQRELVSQVMANFERYTGCADAAKTAYSNFPDENLRQVEWCFSKHIESVSQMTFDICLEGGQKFQILGAMRSSHKAPVDKVVDCFDRLVKTVQGDFNTCIENVSRLELRLVKNAFVLGYDGNGREGLYKSKISWNEFNGFLRRYHETGQETTRYLFEWEYNKKKIDDRRAWCFQTYVKNKTG